MRSILRTDIYERTKNNARRRNKDIRSEKEKACGSIKHRT